MPQDQKAQTSHPNNTSIEVKEQDLHTIVGGICDTCGKISFAAQAEADGIKKRLPNEMDKDAYGRLVEKGYSFQKLANDAYRDSISFPPLNSQGAPLQFACHNCITHSNKLDILKWGHGQ